MSSHPKTHQNKNGRRVSRMWNDWELCKLLMSTTQSSSQIRKPSCHKFLPHLGRETGSTTALTPASHCSRHCMSWKSIMVQRWQENTKNSDMLDFKSGCPRPSRAPHCCSIMSHYKVCSTFIFRPGTGNLSATTKSCQNPFDPWFILRRPKTLLSSVSQCS